MTPERERKRERKGGGEIKAGTHAAAATIGGNEAWTLFFTEATLVPGRLSKQILSAAYPKQHESGRTLISPAGDYSRWFKETWIFLVFDKLSSGR